VTADVELYTRDTMLDLGHGPTIDGLDDPLQWPKVPVAHSNSPNIKVHAPTPFGYQTSSSRIDFYQ
jgi:hypothetical protein